MVTIPERPNQIGLPFDDWRPDQREVLSRVASSQSDTVILEAPTAFGKSTTGAAISRVTHGRGIILTHTIALQDQYSNSFPHIPSLKGAANFEANIEDYFAQRDRGLASSVFVTNYQWFLRAANRWKPPQKVDWLICDEAHQIEEAIGNFMTLKLDRSRCTDFGLDMPSGTNCHPLQNYLRSVMPRVEEALALSRQRLCEGRNVSKLVKELEDLVWGFRSILNQGLAWVSTERDGIIEMKPSLPGGLADRLLFRHARHHLLMSATIFDHVWFAHNLGLENWESIAVPNSIPAASRPVYYWPVASMSKSRREANSESLHVLVRAVDQIITKLRGQRGVIHTVNYEISRFVVQNSTYRQIMITHESAHTRGEALAKFQDISSSILVSPSMDMGVDLPYDSARWQIICKIPFPSIGDPGVEARRIRHPEWYAWKTLTRLIQTCGRIVRAEDDYGQTYILDSDFVYLKPHFNIVPAWFWEAFTDVNQQLS